MAGPIAQWRSEEKRLSTQLDQARDKLAALWDAGASSLQINQARLGELAAVKQYNDFLNTAKQDYAKATQYEARLRNDPNLSALDRQQLEGTRDALNARAGEFQQFANDSKLYPQSANPVKLDGKIYFDDGHTAWDTTTPRGILGSAIDSSKAAFSAGLEWITPSNATNQLACAEGFNSVVGAVSGKVLNSPGNAVNPAAEKALEEVWGQAKGSVMKPGDGVCKMLYPAGDPNVEDLRKAGLISELELPGEFGDQYLVLDIPAELVAYGLVGAEVENRVRNGAMTADEAYAILGPQRDTVPEHAIGLLPYEGATEFDFIEDTEVVALPDIPVTTAPETVSAVGVLGSVQSMLSLIQAIESGDTKAIVAASAAMLANLDALRSDVHLLPSGVGAGLNALAAGLNLFNAIQDGDGLGIAASSLNLGSQAATIYANMLKDQGIAAYEAGATTAGNSLMESAGTMGQVAGGLALVASVVSLVMAIEDGNGYQIASAALSTAAAGFAVAG
ncbi:hypothetical protein ACIP1U_32395, partial [Cupriavidus sp. NPDC089707]|uniref:hypothetical protein n=1 Tax=Cupriavidus sp. NPDC089707 TaxID=3363963 RepID=UPI003808ADBE